MSEAPERIWVNDKGEAYQRRTCDEDTTGYRRADLPPTLSAAMELPEVLALKDALMDMLSYSGAYHPSGRKAVAALAAIKEPKT